MLRISKLTDYAVVLATHLAACPQPHNVRDLALETRIPQPTVSKVLKRLARHGLVVSQRGVHGGYRLARGADEINVADVIAALEGPIAVTECSNHVQHACEYEGGCGVQAHWQRINSAVHDALSGITLADMARPQMRGLVPLKSSPRHDGNFNRPHS